MSDSFTPGDGYALVMRVGGQPERIVVTLRAEPGYDAIRDLVSPLLDGGHMEHVAVLHDGQRRDMFVDEEGVLKRLPRNEAATTIYRANWLSTHPKQDPETLPHICGTAVLFLRRVWF